MILNPFFGWFGRVKPIEKAATLQTLDLLEDSNGLVLRSISDKPPIHRTVKIQSFSLLRNSVDRYEVGNFEAGGYKWKLVLYPNGNKSKNVEGHVSLYLQMDQEKPIGPGHVVAIDFRLFLRNQKKNNYLVLEDANKKKKYVFYKTIIGGPAGFDQFIPLEEFTDASNGYLIDDTCEFGVEVFVSKEIRTGKGECLVSMIKDVTKSKHTWKISNFSKLADQCHISRPFTLANQKYCAWDLRLYPNGDDQSMRRGSHISLYAELAILEYLPPGSKILAEITLRMLDQINGNHHSRQAYKHWFSVSTWNDFGWTEFISQDLLRNSDNGFLVKDCCIVEAEITICGVEFLVN